MIGPHAALTDASEGQVVLPHVHDGVVDAGTAGHGAIEHMRHPALIPVEVVQGEWSGAVVYVADGALDVVVATMGG